MFSATAIANFLACHHITALERAQSRGELKKPFFSDPTVNLLRKLGIQHEQRYLHQLADDEGLRVVQICTDDTWEDAARQTVEALRGRADAVFQATFLDGPWGGRSD